MNELDTFAAELGQDSSYIQGAGGNISCKLGETLRIKASGAWMAEAKKRSVFVELSLKTLRQHLRERQEDYPVLQRFSNRRASIETPLHVLMPHTVVVHVHCVHTVARTLLPHAEKLLQERIPDLAWNWIPYFRPGLPLADAVRFRLSHCERRPDILILANHGLVVGGSDISEVKQRLREIRQRLSLPERPAPPPDFTFLKRVNTLDWKIPAQRHWHALAADSDTLSIIRQGIFYPDHAVFLGKDLPLGCSKSVETASEACARLTACHGKPPQYLLYPGAGILVSPQAGPEILAMLEALALVAARCPGGTTLQTLSHPHIDELLHWDAEIYRRSVLQEEA